MDPNIDSRQSFKAAGNKALGLIFVTEIATIKVRFRAKVATDGRNALGSSEIAVEMDKEVFTACGREIDGDLTTNAAGGSRHDSADAAKRSQRNAGNVRDIRAQSSDLRL